MESSISNKQRTIQAEYYVFQAMQLTRNILEDDEQYILRTITWRNTHKLHGWLCNTKQNQERIRKNNMILEGYSKV